jgi:hypothetical protein
MALDHAVALPGSNPGGQVMSQKFAILAFACPLVAQLPSGPIQSTL